jgi:cysteine desulfurase/selenocysteine lyase
MDVERIRGDFPAFRDWVYLDNAFVGLFPRQVREGYDVFLDRWMEFGAEGTKTILTEWLEKAAKVRGMIADFIGASPQEIAYTTCTGSGLNIVVNGMTWERGDNVVFPAWEHNPLYTTTLRRHNVEARAVEAVEGRVDLADMERAMDDRTRLVQVSQVSYVNGFRFDLREVADMAHDHGAKVLVDATQALGALVTDVKRENVDFVSAAPYKYLMGPAGLAFLYVDSESLGELAPDRVGWKNQIWQGDRAEAASDEPESAEKFEYGTIHFQGVYGLERSLEYLNEIGMEDVERRVLDLSGYLWSRLRELGKAMLTPEGTRSPVVSFNELRATEIAADLMIQRIKVTGREAHGGHVIVNGELRRVGHIRVSPHFYNTMRDIDEFIDALSNLT